MLSQNKRSVARATASREITAAIHKSDLHPIDIGIIPQTSNMTSTLNNNDLTIGSSSSPVSAKVEFQTSLNLNNNSVALPSTPPLFATLPDEAKEHTLSTIVDAAGNNALLAAIALNNLPLVESLLDQGYDPNVRNPKTKATAMDVALTVGSDAILKRLFLCHHPKPEFSIETFVLAFDRLSDEAINTIVAHGAWSEGDWKTAWRCCCDGAGRDLMRRLIDLHNDAYTRNSPNWVTALLDVLLRQSTPVCPERMLTLLFDLFPEYHLTERHVNEASGPCFLYLAKRDKIAHYTKARLFQLSDDPPLLAEVLGRQNVSHDPITTQLVSEVSASNWPTLLAKSNQSLDEPLDNGMSLLGVAIKRDWTLSTIQFIIARQVNLRQVFWMQGLQITALSLATKLNNTAVVRLLIENGALQDVGVQTELPSVTCHPYYWLFCDRRYNQETGSVYDLLHQANADLWQVKIEGRPFLEWCRPHDTVPFEQGWFGWKKNVSLVQRLVNFCSNPVVLSTTYFALTMGLVLRNVDLYGLGWGLNKK
jgi:hypothetical protein